MFDYCEQAEKTEDDRVTKLLEILGRQDKKRLPDLYEVLENNDQRHIADMLRKNVLQQQQLHGECTLYFR